VPNDVRVSQVIHKIGWKGLPSTALEYGDEGDCHGYLVGEEHRGLRYMFQMMNEARLMVGMNGAATASVAYHEARLYALSRPQGRGLGQLPSSPVVPIVQHADVRRMLLRQKAIVEGSLALLATTARFADVAPARLPTRPRASGLRRCWTCSRPSPRPFRRSVASTPTRWPCRCWVGTATPASTCRRATCVTSG
jgi:alkylation response protein AidB-like acyl-CoA dehydrogenase